jgi:Flp pilus assembly protein TadD
LRNATGMLVGLLLVWGMNAHAEVPVRAIVSPLDSDTGIGVLAWLGEGIAMSLSEQIESRNLKVIGRDERIRLVESVDLPPGGRISRGSLIRVAQQAKVDLLVMGRFSGTEKSLKIALRVLDLKTLKLSGEMTANGPLSAMPQMENELAWLILTNSGLEKTETREEFQKRMRKVPNAAYSYFIQSLESANKGSQIQSLKRALELCRDFPQAQLRIGQLYFSRKDCDGALPYLVQGRGDGSRDPESDFMLGTCRAVKYQADQAIPLLAHVVSISRSYEALNNLGVAYLRKGDFASATRALLEAKNLAHSDATASLNFAVVHLIQGSDSAASRVIEDALRLHPKNGMLQFLHSIVLKRLGEEEKSAGAAAKARSFGVNVDAMQNEDPQNWSRILFDREH